MSNLRAEINNLVAKVYALLDENEALKEQLSQQYTVSNLDLRELITDEEFVINNHNVEFLKQVDQLIIDEFDLSIGKSKRKALLIFTMDTSGSMGLYEKYISRCVIERLERLFKLQYSDITIKYISHHTEAKEVTKHELFNKGETGGTITTSAFRLANELIENFDYIENDVYMFHFSDGDNLTSDNERCVKTLQKILMKSCMVGYVELNQYNRHSTLMTAFKHISDYNFMHFTIREKDDVYDALKEFTQVIF
jgi:uncharacterized sporulation protein YeaH/YhbH (DUF444 family)